MSVIRGEIWTAELDPTQGSEQAGRRPVLVLQNDAINRFTTTVLAIPLTTNLRRASLPSCVQVTQGDGGLASDSVVTLSPDACSGQIPVEEAYGHFV